MPIVDIALRGAREHNLKNITVTFPRNRLTVITGLSGSGKSTLVFDTLYAEGQRRYVESLSTYARQFIEQLKKPDVDAIDGLSPPIAIEQRSISKNPRSTVGTLTEIYDFLRLLYARIGKARCHQCHQPITPQTLEQMAQQILAFPKGTFFALLSPVVRGKKGEFKDELAKLRKSGFSRALVDGSLIDLGAPPILSKTHLHDIDVFIDLIEVKREIRPRVTSAIDLAVGLSGGFVKAGIISQGTDRRPRHPQHPKKLVPFVRELFFSRHNACMRCGISLPDIEPRLFSFNSPYGACALCNGLGALKFTRTAEEREDACPACESTRLRPEACSIFINDLNIADVARLDVTQALEFFSTLSLTEREKKIAHLITKEIKSRLKFLCNVGVSYLTLSRSSQTLSGGELQRIRLATQLGSSLLGVIYILDEPSIGLHHVDEMKLIRTLQALRDLGNTVIVVEHDEMMMRKADFLIDMGPQG
ncbi:MAG: ABC-ATPase UvrA, partial [Deltaproteobacteria bacterium]|nr:ABC-ATPase UvrA [Deltaproteobacteria bacterium]